MNKVLILLIAFALSYAPAFAQNAKGHILFENFAQKGKTIDDSKWAIINGPRAGYYCSNKNVFIKNGALNLVAKKESAVDANGNAFNYTSAMIWSRFRYKYGMLSFRAKIPTGDGVFPALWLKGDDSFAGAACGEIDLLESVGVSTSFYSTCWKFDGIQATDSQAVTVGSGPWSHGTVVPWKINVHNWNTYTLVWKPGEAIFYLNGRQYARMQKPWIASTPMRVVMSLPSGGRGVTSNTPTESVLQVQDMMLMCGPNSFYPTYPHTP